jgi:hypothetical protein
MRRMKASSGSSSVAGAGAAAVAVTEVLVVVAEASGDLSSVAGAGAARVALCQRFRMRDHEDVTRDWAAGCAWPEGGDGSAVRTVGGARVPFRRVVIPLCECFGLRK